MAAVESHSTMETRSHFQTSVTLASSGANPVRAIHGIPPKGGLALIGRAQRVPDLGTAWWWRRGTHLVDLFDATSEVRDGPDGDTVCSKPSRVVSTMLYLLYALWSLPVRPGIMLQGHEICQRRN